MLRIPHGTSVIRPGISWLVADDEPIRVLVLVEGETRVFLARHVLAALGLNNRLLLTEAADRHSGAVDFPNLRN